MPKIRAFDLLLNFHSGRARNFRINTTLPEATISSRRNKYRLESPKEIGSRLREKIKEKRASSPTTIQSDQRKSEQLRGNQERMALP
jgi:hypothetical protein